jgi:anti-anti-sigma factor
MALKVHTQVNSELNYTVSLDGRLDTETAAQCEEHLASIIGHAQSIIFDMAGLSYISGMGLRLILKTDLA